MAASTTIDGLRVDEDGVLQRDPDILTGTVYDTANSTPVSANIRFTEQDGKTYCYANGALARERWVSVGGEWYLTGSDGSLYQSQWVYEGYQWENYWYWFDRLGRMYVNGWLTFEDGNTYYFYPNGRMAYNTTIDGHRLNASGVRVS